MLGVSVRSGSAELHAPVRAGVDERSQSSVGTAHDERRAVADVIDLEISWGGYVFLATSPLPGSRPQSFEPRPRL